MPLAEARLFAVAAPGLEEVVAAELRELRARRAGGGLTLGGEDVGVVPGGVEWTGGLGDVYAGNLWSRVATRIYLRVGEVKARAFEELRRGVAGLPWERWVAPGAAVEVTAAAKKCRL